MIKLLKHIEMVLKYQILRQHGLQQVEMPQYILEHVTQGELAKNGLVALMKQLFMIQPKILVGLQVYMRVELSTEVKVVLQDIGNLMKVVELPLKIIQEMVIMELLLPFLETQQLIQLGKKLNATWEKLNETPT